MPADGIADGMSAHITLANDHALRTTKSRLMSDGRTCSHADLVMAYIGMAYIVMAYVVMAYTVMAYRVRAYIVMAYIVMAFHPPVACRSSWHAPIISSSRSSLMPV